MTFIQFKVYLVNGYILKCRVICTLKYKYNNYYILLHTKLSDVHVIVKNFHLYNPRIFVFILIRKLCYATLLCTKQLILHGLYLNAYVHI